MNRYSKVLWMALAAALCVNNGYAQQNPPQPGPTAPQIVPPGLSQAGADVTQIFDVKYADVNTLMQVLSVFNVQMFPSPQLHVLSVRAPKEIMPAIADAIKRLDVPPPPPPPSKNVELIIYVVNAFR
jgi:Bacterial type II/III secretion system short domain